MNSLIFSILVLTSAAHAEIGVTDDKILLGQSTALTGSGAQQAKLQKEGAMVYLNQINKAGGVHGRKIELLTYDDAYEPPKSVENMKKLIESDKVFAFFNNYGGAAAKASRNWVEEKNVPAIATSASQEELRNGPNKNIFFVRASSKIELNDLMQAAKEHAKAKTIASVYQNDAIGVAANLATHESAKAHGLTVGYAGGVQRNTATVDSAVDSIVLTKPDAVVLGVKGDAASEVIKKTLARKFSPTFLIISSGLSPELITTVKETKAKLFLTNVTPFLASGDTYPLVQEFQKEAKAAGVTPNDLHVEGYLAARVLVEGLKRAGRDLTRDSLRNAMESLGSIEVGGVKVSYSKDSHRGCDRAYIGTIVDGSIKPLTAVQMK